jgi:hypothetical protein
MDDRELMKDVAIFIVALTVVALAFFWSNRKHQHDAFIQECSQGRWTEEDCERMWRMGND